MTTTINTGTIIILIVIYAGVFGLIWGLALPIALLLFLAGCWLTLQAIGHEYCVNRDQQRCRQTSSSHIVVSHPLSENVHTEHNKSSTKKQTVSFAWGRAQDNGRIIGKFDRRLTGSSVIDAEINTTIDAAFNLYVKPWFSQLFQPYFDDQNTDSWLDTDEVMHELRLSINKIFIALANPCKDADFAQYLTTGLVNDFATHVRIFRRAKEFAPFRPPTTHNARDPYSTVLVANFFKAEQRTPVVSLGSGGSTAASGSESDSAEAAGARGGASFCREQVACDAHTMRDYLLLLSDILFYLLADRADFTCTIHRELFNEIFTTTVLLPTMDVLSQPDTINRILLWLLQDVECDIDAFLIAIRSPGTTRDELIAIRECVEHEMDVHRAKDSSTEQRVKEALKAQLQSLEYLQRLIDRKLRALSMLSKPKVGARSMHPDSERNVSSADSAAMHSASNYRRIDRLTPIQHLGLQDVLSNNVALSYFIDFLQTHDTHHLLFFYLTIEGFRLTAIQDEVTYETDNDNPPNVPPSTPTEKSLPNTENMPKIKRKHATTLLRESAMSIFDQYLSDKSIHPLTKYLPSIKRSGEVRRLWTRILSSDVARQQHTMFDNLQQKVHVKLNDECFPAFRASPQYWHMLGDLDLLRNTAETSVGSNMPPSTAKIVAATNKASRADDNVAENSTDNTDTSENSAPGFSENHVDKVTNLSLAVPKVAEKADDEWNISAELTAALILTDTRRSGISTKYAAYRLEVTHRHHTANSGRIWETFRRYSEFLDLHVKIQRRFPNLHGLSFPAKEMNNLRPDVMERRKRTLALYLHTLLYRDVLKSNKGLLDLMLVFLAPGEYDPSMLRAAIGDTTVTKSLGTFNSPVLVDKQNRSLHQHAATNVLSDSAQSMKRNVKAIGENVLQLSSNMSSQVLNSLSGLLATTSPANIRKSILSNANNNSSTAAADEQEVLQNIPLRIMLLLMDEVFDLRNRNQWLRSRIIGILSSIVRATLGVSMNRKIVQFVEFLLSPEKLASYVANLRELFLVADAAQKTPPDEAANDTLVDPPPADVVILLKNSPPREDAVSNTSSNSAGRGIMHACLGNDNSHENLLLADSATLRNTTAAGIARHRSVSEHDDDELDSRAEKNSATSRSRSQFYLQHQRSSSSSSHRNATLKQQQGNYADTQNQCENNTRRGKRQHSADAPARNVAGKKNSVPDGKDEVDRSVAPTPEATREEKLRCQIKVLVKAKMLSLTMTQFQSILGTRTVQMGTFTLFDIFQYPALNKRLLTILIEGCLQVLFTHNAKQISARLRTFHNQHQPNSSVLKNVAGKLTSNK